MAIMANERNRAPFMIGAQQISIVSAARALTSG
jgi:hypothetical protein